MMADHGTVTGITVDLSRNGLLLHLDSPASRLGAIAANEQKGILDVGINGWLLGVEIADAYFPIADAEPGTDHLTRSCEARLWYTEDWSAIVVLRRGQDYELSFPSGNQCWIRHSGETGAPMRVCSTVTSSR